MVEIDPVLWAIVIAMLGLLMWAVTNIHLRNEGRAIKADIDAKRASTEEFVRGELRILKADLPTDTTDERLQAWKDELTADFKVEIQDLEGRLQTVQIDAGPLMAQVQAELIPAVEAKIEHVKAVIQGAKGYAIKGVKALGEGVAELTGERVLEDAGVDMEWQRRLQEYGLDEEWLKTHKTAAFGLSLLKEALGRGEDVQIGVAVPPGTKRVGPPEGFR